MTKQNVVASIQSASVIYRTESGEGKQVWSDISMDIFEGEWITVTGSNGSGKSTLASVLLGLCPLSSGELVRGDREEVLIRGVLQTPDAQFVGDTVKEELEYSSDTQHLTRQERAVQYGEILEAVGLFVELDRVISTLSGGQKQLLNIAAALAAKPDVLILDEPTAMLDPASRKEVIQAVKGVYMKGTTVIWITHRMEEAAEADRVIAFGAGKLAFDGSPRMFFYGETYVGNRTVGNSTPCARLGMEPPFVVQTALALSERGVKLPFLPLHAAELAKAVSEA